MDVSVCNSTGGEKMEMCPARHYMKFMNLVLASSMIASVT